MSAMSFREPNEVLWRGVRPAHRGSQKAVWASSNNSTDIIYTVSSGATLYLCTAMVGIRVNVAGWYRVFLRDGADVLKWIILQGCADGTDSIVPSVITFWPPVEIAGDWDICVQSNAAGLDLRGFIYGFEE